MSTSFEGNQRITQALLEDAVARYPRIRFASSFGKEDMVLTDWIARHRLPITIFTLDTGKLHAETLAIMGQAQTRYNIVIERLQPLPDDLATLDAAQKTEAIYESVAARRACCEARKVRPLARALAGAQAWITGQRRAQSITRAQLPFAEHDSAHGIEKLNPLAHWSNADVDAYIAQHNVPVNVLHAQGFASIGCAPCTRAIAPGEDERAGRWWWESPEHKECGLHNNPKRPRIAA